MAKIWMIASGKGGVGKSTVTASVALALARHGKKVCVVDTDIGLRDQDALLGVESRIVFDLLDVAERVCALSQALVSPEGEANLSLLPASQFARVKELDRRAFRRVLTELRETFDMVLIDCPAGIERGLRGLMNKEIDETVVICTPDDVCIRNVERVIPIMENKELPRPRVIVNRLLPNLVRAGEMYSAQTVAATLDLPLLGEIPDDPCVYRAMLQHLSVIDIDCEARAALLRIAQRMSGMEVPLPGYGSAPLPWYRRFLAVGPKEVKRLDR